VKQSCSMAVLHGENVRADRSAASSSSQTLACAREVPVLVAFFLPTKQQVASSAASEQASNWIGSQGVTQLAQLMLVLCAFARNYLWSICAVRSIKCLHLSSTFTCDSSAFTAPRLLVPRRFSRETPATGHQPTATHVLELQHQWQQ